MSAQEDVTTGMAGEPLEGGLLPRPDELLARLVASGGERPFRALYERYHAQLYRYCHSILRNEADAQDALQSTFTRALVALREERRTAPLRPWLYRIAHNESISLLRARRPLVPESERDLVALALSAEECADKRARLELLLADLAQLADRARAALVMRELGGLSHEEIAAALQISAGAAKQAIFEARSALFELAEGRAMACPDVRRKLSDGDRRVLRSRQVRAHLRDCASCSAFAAAIPARQEKLRAVCPALPAATAAAVLARVLEGATAHGGRAAAGASAASSGSTIAGTGGGSAGASSAAASAAKVLAAVVTPKALLATAVIAGGAAGAGGLVAGSPAKHTARAFSDQATPALRLAAPARPGHNERSSPTLSHPGSPPPRSQATQSNATTARAQTHQSSHGQAPVASGHRNDGSQTAAAPGSSASAPGQTNNGNQTGSAHGNSASAPGQSGSHTGNSASAPGHTGSSPGHSGTAPGRSNTPMSRTGTAPGLARHQHTPAGQTKSHRNPHARSTPASPQALT